ncbi:hypothetical protein IUS98_24940, partial [Mycobacteroides abscessus subsp. abscessus]|nr:hypothetical protein [Mycobacteroides abscessus subsp. abscessus]
MRSIASPRTARWSAASRFIAPPCRVWTGSSMSRRDDVAGVLLVCSSRLRWARSVSTRRISSRAAVIRARAASVSTTGRGVWSMLAAAQPPAFVGAVSG